MELINKQYMDKYNNEDYVWYACYGSNIMYKKHCKDIDKSNKKMYNKS